MVIVGNRVRSRILNTDCTGHSTNVEGGSDKYTVLEGYALRIEPGDLDTLMRHTIHTYYYSTLSSRAEHVNTLHHKYGLDQLYIVTVNPRQLQPYRRLYND